jgi:hypothetical protein
MEFGLGHRALQPEEQTVVVLPGIVQPIEVGDESAMQRAELQQLIPVPAGTGQSRHLNTEHETDVPECDRADQLLKALPVLGGRTRHPEVTVDDLDAIGGPAKLHRLLPQAVLQASRLSMFEHLALGRLANIDHRKSGPMRGGDLLR